MDQSHEKDSDVRGEELAPLNESVIELENTQWNVPYGGPDYEGIGTTKKGWLHADGSIVVVPTTIS